jgi:hypothetical protein
MELDPLVATMVNDSEALEAINVEETSVLEKTVFPLRSFEKYKEVGFNPDVLDNDDTSAPNGFRIVNRNPS